MKKAELKQIPIELLKRGQYQMREDFNSERLQELAESIKEQGLIEPIVVRPLAEDQFEIIAGERRWRAAQLAGLADIPCLVNHYSNEQAAAVTLIENIQRQDLNVIEEAKGYQKLIDDFFFYQDEVAKIVGKSRSHVANILRILELDKKVQKALIEQQISFGHARVLVGLSAKQQIEFTQKVIKNQWSVRKLEAEIKKIKQLDDFVCPRKDKNIERLESLISETVGAQAEIEQSEADSGWLKIKFFDNDTLAGLLDKIGVDYD